MYAGLLPFPPNLSLPLSEPVTLFDHTEELHQQGHGRILTLSTALTSLLENMRRSARTYLTLNSLLATLTFWVILAWAICCGNKNSW